MSGESAVQRAIERAMAQPRPPPPTGASRRLLERGIGRPFRFCPRCGVRELGVVMITNNRIVRRCRECWFDSATDLPKLSPKKIIYLDQFAISEMAKATNPALGKQGRVPPIWAEIYEQLRRLIQLQVAVCPWSSFHRAESLLSPFYDAARSVYRELSGGISFENPTVIQQAQLMAYVPIWITGDIYTACPMRRRDAFDEDPDRWTDTIDVIPTPKWPAQWQEDDRHRKQAVASALGEQWEQERRAFPTDIAERVAAELHDYADVMLRQVLRFDYAQRTRDSATAMELAGSDSVLAFQAVGEALARRGFKPDERAPEIIRFFRSPMLGNVPHVRIRAFLWAARFRQARSEGSPPPGSDMVDVEMLSTLLPYCDAMVIDRRMSELLRQISPRVGCDTTIFSSRELAGFLDYLTDIERGVPEEHVAMVEDVLGQPGPTR